MNETVIKEATFNPKVKTYWTITWVFVAAITLVGIIAIPVVAIIAWILSDRMLASISAKLQERKLVVKRGIWFVVEKSIPLEKITDVALSQGPLMRMFGLYKLSFETAGQSAQGALVALTGINDASEFREAILEQKDKLSSDSSIQTEASVSSSPASTSDGNADIAKLSQSVQNIENMLAQILASKQK